LHLQLEFTNFNNELG